MSEQFRVSWEAGPSAQVELFSPNAEQAGVFYRMKYTPPFRSTIRPPLEELRLGEKEIGPVNQTLDDLVTALDARSAQGVAVQNQPVATVDDKLVMIGEQLFTLLIPRYVQVDVRTPGLFLEIGMDENLLGYPWELMHDGEDFMCLKHYMGRFVNASANFAPRGNQMSVYPYASLSSPLEKLSILVISVPCPQPRGITTYPRLLEAESEANKIIALLNDNGVKPEFLNGRNATYDLTFRTLRQKRYHIIHFCGHALFNDQQPYLSGLALFDRDLTTGALTNIIEGTPPVLCFINACDTAKSVEIKGWKGRYSIYGLARAFLDTGAYLLGSRWKIGDKTASTFATQFYTSLIRDGKSIGESVLESRKACRTDVPEDPFGWVSYSLYGDPRVVFKRLTTAD
jgi:hypothetical protein